MSSNPAGLGVALCITLAVTTASASRCRAQGTFRITFDGPPRQAPGTDRLIQRYDEARMSFVALPGSQGFVLSGGDQQGFADSGSPYVAGGVGTALEFSLTNRNIFDLVSVDLAEWSIVVTNATVPFVGFKPDGSSVVTTFTTDTIIDGPGGVEDFETFYFGPEFSNLTRVEMPQWSWSMDNVVVSVPEPALVGLLGVSGLISLVVCRSRGRSRIAAGSSDGIG